MRVPYYIVVEGQEVDQYAAVVERRKLLVLDKSYQRDYATFDKLGDEKSKGPGAARNFAWDHAVKLGSAWHWVMDDNIRLFGRLNKNKIVEVGSAAFFEVCESFVHRYTNVAMAGPNDFAFAGSKSSARPPITVNTRIYSCNLIRNDAPYRWRGRYNEDTDLSLRMLKDGWCTILFNAFLMDKKTTQTGKGGNTAAFYDAEGTLPKSQMQVRMHPDVSKLVWKFNRWHHTVDYRPFKRNRLIRKEGIEIPAGVDNYGMKLVNADQ